MIEAYDSNYYIESSKGSVRSAKEIVPYLMKMEPKSVIDIGCGIGSFLSVFIENGVADYIGVDSPNIPKDLLLFDKDKFIGSDLESILPNIDRKFDLCISLEVAEHLSGHLAEQFVGFLVSLSDIIIFSAAIPQQGGVSHLNEQWPSYWCAKFLKYYYLPFDYLRPQFWNNFNIEFWYRQNMLMFVNWNANVPKYLLCKTDLQLLDVVHPRAFELRSEENKDARRRI